MTGAPEAGAASITDGEALLGRRRKPAALVNDDFIRAAWIGDMDATDPTGFPSEPQIGVHVSDPGGPNEIIIYKGWLASSAKQCFAIDSMAAPCFRSARH